MRECEYCKNIFSLNADTPKQPWNTVLYETPNFVVVPTTGAMVEGWILIISKRHVPAMGALTLEELSELNELFGKMRHLIKSVYGAAVVFEHGPICGGTTFGCGIDHAHFHIVPIKNQLIPLVEKALEGSPNWTTVENVQDLSIVYSMGIPYLYISENGSDRGYVAGLLNVPSQFMRRVIASELGIPSLYDYKEHKFRSNVVSTLRQLSSIQNIITPVLV
jgi:diadenosine tetraphosphate (Ap4A) HIT family hydrolase